MFKAIDTQVFVQMDDCFGIGVGFELMARSFESMAKFFVVVDFPIKDNLDRAVFIAERLMAGRKIDNRKATKP